MKNKEKITQLLKEIDEIKKLELNKIPKPPKPFTPFKKIEKHFIKKGKEIIEKKKEEVVEFEKEQIVLYKSPLHKIKKWRITGYILYEITKKSKDFVLVGVNNFSDIYKSKWGKAYIKHDMLGSINRKPLLIIKNHLPLSLKIKPLKSTKKNSKGKFFTDGYELCYNPETFYNTFEYITFANLRITDKQRGGFSEFLSKHWWKLLIIGLILGFVLLTPQGKELINQLGEEMIFRHY